MQPLSRVLAADRQYVLFMIALPLVLSGLCLVLPGDGGLSLASTAKGSPQSLFLVLVVGGALMGSAASIRELVKERAIYRRERAIGLSRHAYVWSKLLVLGLITGVQGLLLGVLGNVGRPPPDSAATGGSATVEIVAAVVGVTVVSMILGLVLSALIDNADRGMPLLVLLAMLQFILSSAIVQIGGIPVLAQVSWLVPARWGFAMGASTIGLDGRPPNIERDPLWEHAAAPWFVDLGCLAAIAVLFVVTTFVLLRRVEPRRRRAVAVGRPDLRGAHA